jgi:hypothetical protein
MSGWKDNPDINMSLDASALAGEGGWSLNQQEIL